MSKSFDPNRPYKLAEVYSAGGDVSKQWYVYYFFLHPDTMKWKMFKKTAQINYIKDGKKRLREMRKLQSTINGALERGFNPFGQNLSRQNMSTLKASLERWSSEHLVTLASRTRSTNKSGVNFLLRYFETVKKPNIQAGEVTKENINAALTYWMREKKWTNRNRNNHLSRWRTFFNWLISQDAITANPCDKIPFLKVYPTDRNRPPTEEEFERIVNHLYKHDRQLFLYAMIIYYQGFRVTETGRLKVSNIEFKAEHPFFRLAAHQQKDNEDTVQFVSPHLLKYFFEFGIDKLPVNYYLFSFNLLPSATAKSKIKELAEDRWRKQVKEHLQIDVNLYSMKHKQATELGESVSSIKDISNFLRHSTEDVTKNYMKKYKPTVSFSFFKNQRPLPIKNKKS